MAFHQGKKFFIIENLRTNRFHFSFLVKIFWRVQVPVRMQCGRATHMATDNANARKERASHCGSYSGNLQTAFKVLIEKD